MATAEQIKSLIKSHLKNEHERFYTTALQMAAHEAKLGHRELANEIKNLVDQERQKSRTKVIPFPRDLKSLVLTEVPEISKSSLVLADDLTERIKRIILEYRQRSKLKSHGLQHRRKILLIGPPGTGKTMTAKVLGRELKLQLHTIQVDRLVTKFMGETSAKLRQIFELIEMETAVYLFDEFDAIGGERSMDNDVGEMRRVLNAFLQFIEQDHSDSLIVAATNNPKLLDQALFRRFDDVLYYEPPDENDQKRLMGNILGTFLPKRFAWKSVLKESNGLSHAEIQQACTDATKNAILSDKNAVTSSILLESLKHRQNVHHGLRR
jgi:SpoVK/Ycf46/Vps4 family AAA+-type ATPase